MKEQPNQRKSMLYYYGIALIIILLLNIFVFPALLQPQVREVPYDEFISLVDADKVAEVSQQDSMIVFTAKDDTDRLMLYKTGIWAGDTGLTERLLAHNVKFAAGKRYSRLRVGHPQTDDILRGIKRNADHQRVRPIIGFR